jgi:hypothetical protein
MVDSQYDPSEDLMLDGNAAAGLLQDIFGTEMTASPTECAHCGRAGPIGALYAFGQWPRIVLRCPACENVVLRVVDTHDAFYVDARGAAYLRLGRRPS